MAIEDIKKGIGEAITKAEEIKEQIPNIEQSETDIGGVFTKELQDKLLGELDLVSSEPTELESLIGKSITGLKEAQEKRVTGIEAGAERLAGEIKEKGIKELTSAQEQQRGFAVNRSLIKQIEEDTEKSLKDLEMRKQEALGGGAVELAEKISNLQIQQLQFSQQKKQQSFSNMLQVAGFGLNVYQIQQQKTQQELQNKKDTLNFLVSNNLMSSMGEEDKRKWETNLNLPSNVLDKVKPQDTFQEVGDSLLRIYFDPITGTKKVETVWTKPDTVGKLGVFDSVLQKTIDSGATPQEAIETAQMYASGLGITLKEPDLSSLLIRAKTMKPTTLVPPTPEVPPTLEEREAKAERTGELAKETIKALPGEAKEKIFIIPSTIKGFFEGLFSR